MKTQIKNIIAAAFLFASTSLNAGTGTGERSIHVSTKNSKAVVLQLDNMQSGTAVSIRSEEGTVLFQDEISESAYTKVFNLKSLKAGEVYLEIESDEQLEVMAIKITDTAAFLEKSSALVIEKAIVKMNGDMAKVFFGQHEGETKVTLFDQSNDIVYRHKTQNGSFKSYDLSKLSAGHYTFQFKSAGKTFYHSITLK